ncbi:MAG TPA: TonB-dependent receptor [Rhizomicrobium sp.]|nr:TonB-dependent receptor [Rhizomicrobium sp.]
MTRPNTLGLRSALFIGSALAIILSTAASAQNDIETVVVTGSRIPTTNASSPSPISVKTDAEIKMTAAFSLEDVLRTMMGPDQTNGSSNVSNNGGVGVSEIGLRNLGPARTLVLVDGQRLVPVFTNFVGAASLADLNSVPIAMVDRIEVLRDGASSIYGADAIGGVVNIITKKNFEGLQIDAHGGVSQHGGGDEYGVIGTLGINVDRGNLTMSILNEHKSVVDQADRSWAQDPHIGDPDNEGGSSFRSQLNILQDENSHTVWNDGIETTYNDPTLGGLPCLTYLPTLGRVKLNAGCPDIPGGQTLQGSIGRTQIALNGHYDITPDVTFVAQAFFTRRDSEQRLRPEPLLGDQIASTNPLTGQKVFGGFMVPVSWPGFSDPNGTAVITPFDASNGVGCKDPAGCITAYLTPNEFGPRDYKQVADTYRVRFGLQGNILSDYHWEIGYVLQRNDTTQRVLNSGNWLRLAQATGQTPCVDVPGGCVFSPAFGYSIPATPFNFFNGIGTLSPEQVAYLTYTMIDTNNSYQNYGYANINGPLFELPAGKVEGSLGVERRFEHLADSPDALVQLGYAANPSAPTSGGYNVTSVYGELRIPVLKDVPMAQSLVITPSARFDHYSSFGSAKTWKIGGDWQVIDDLRFRGTYATGFRAPSVAELFGGQGISYIPVSGDPCDSRIPTASGINGNANGGLGSLAPGSACYVALTAQGLTPAEISAFQSPENNLANDQRGLIVGGNPNLKPEQSRSWNIGAVLTPTFLPGFVFNIDYYEVKVTNSILTGGIAQNAGPDLVVLGCYVAQNPTYCSQISRNASGIFQIGSLNTNFGTTQVRGMDLQATYSTRAAGLELPVPGDFTINLEAGREFLNSTQNPDGTTNSYVGTFLYSNDSIQPTWRSTLNLNYTFDWMSLHWDVSYYAGAKNHDDPTIIYGNHIPAYFYHNISAAFDLGGMVSDTNLVKGLSLVVGINNLADKDPPFLNADGICKCNSFAGGPYDFLGRFFYTRLSVKG